MKITVSSVPTTSNMSPHSGQNFGGFLGSSGSQPHLLHLQVGTPAGFGLPQFRQNLPLLTVSHEQVQPSDTGCSFPQFMQNLPDSTIIMLCPSFIEMIEPFEIMLSSHFLLELLFPTRFSPFATSVSASKLSQQKNSLR